MHELITVTHIGPYRLGRRLGVGGLAAVHEAVDTRDESVWALKVVKKPTKRTHWQDEDFILNRVRHPNIVWARESFETEEYLCLVLELLPGIPLNQVLSALGFANGIPLPYVVEIGIQTCRALHVLHTLTSRSTPLHLTHNDVKPGNLILCRNGRVVLIDMDIATYSGMFKFIQTGNTIGTARYVSPELAISNFGSLDGRSDLFALGTTLVELATRWNPFARHPSIFDVMMAIVHNTSEARMHAQERLEPVAPGLIPIIARLLQAKQEDRYVSARALGRALAALRKDLVGRSASDARAFRRAFRAWAAKTVEDYDLFYAP